MKVFSTVLVALLINSCSCNKSEKAKEENVSDKTDVPAGEEKKEEAVATENDLKIEDVKVGDGAEAIDGKTLEVHYTGTLTDGAKFDSSKDRNATFSFVLGEGRVIKGWDQGMKGMKVGGVRKLTIPSDLAYGDQGISGVIPPKATLLFEVELISVK